VEFIDFIAVNPLAGAGLTGTARKIRWTRAGMGKRGRYAFGPCFRKETRRAQTAETKTITKQLGH